MKQLQLMLGLGTLFFLLYGVGAFAECTVTKLDGSTYEATQYSTGNGPVTLNSCKDLYHPDHTCATDAGQALPACQVQNWIKLPDWGASQDMVIAPHRGIWGYQTNSDGEFVGRDGPPENSLAAIQAAADAGYKVVELDVVLARDDDTDRETNEQILMLGHYAQLERFTNYSRPPATNGEECSPTPCFNTGGVGYTFNTNPQVLLGLNLKTRDGRDTEAEYINNININGFATLEQALELVRDLGMVALIDPKAASPHYDQNGDCDKFCYLTDAVQSQERLEIYDKTVDLAAGLSPSALANVVIKIVYPLTYTNVEGAVGAADIHKVLWSPQTPRRKVVATKAVVLSAIDDWADSHEKDIAVWDTIVFSPHWELGQSFSYEASNYSNILDYVKEVSGKRASLWQIDPAGRRGRMNIYNEWRMAGNNTKSGEEDLRADFITNISYDWARHAVITTDRQDIYRQILSWQ